MAARVNPELQKQLDQSGDRAVQAIFQLRSPSHPETIATPEQAGQVADEILQRVAAQVGESAKRVNVLRNVGTMIIEANADFLNSVIDQPEILSATPSQTAENPFIAPKKKKPV